MATVVVLRTGLSWLKDVRQSGENHANAEEVR